MKIIKIIMATADEKLKNERKELGDYIRTLNDHYHNKGIYFHLNNLLDIETEEEKNREVCESEYFYVIFSDEVEDEIVRKTELAFKNFKEKDLPRIYTYFQKLPDNIDATASVKRFMEKLDKEIGHYYSVFLHLDSIKLNMLLELGRSQAQQGAVAIKDGKALVDGKEMLSLDNVPVFQNNEEFHALLKERTELRKKKIELAIQYAADPDNEEVERQLSVCDERMKKITVELHQMEKEMFSICMNVADLTGSGKAMSWREKAACKCFDAGDYKGALAILSDPNLETELKQAEEVGALSSSKFSEYIRVKRLKIKGLKALGINTETLPGIYECYQEAVKVAEEYFVETGIILEYAVFLYQQNNYDISLEKAEWLRSYYSLKNISARIEETEKGKLFMHLGALYHTINRYVEAEETYKKAIEIWEKAVKENPAINKSGLAKSYNNLGSLLMDTNRYAEAEEIYKKAVKILEKLVKENPAAYEVDLAASNNDIGSLLMDTGRYAEAEEAFKKSILIREKLAKENPAAHESDLASSYNDLGNLLMDTDRHTEAEEAYKNAIAIFKKLAKENPAAYEGYLATCFDNLGCLLAGRKRHAEAEEAYKKAVSVRRKLAEDNPAVYKSDLAASYNNLGSLLMDTKRYDEAEEIYKKAVSIREKLAEENPEAYESDLTTSNNNLANLLKKRSEQ